MNDEFTRFILIAGIIFSIFIIIGIFSLGQTFGQRCEVMYERETPEWNICIDNLSKGIDDDLR